MRTPVMHYGEWQASCSAHMGSDGPLGRVDDDDIVTAVWSLEGTRGKAKTLESSCT